MFFDFFKWFDVKISLSLQGRYIREIVTYDKKREFGEPWEVHDRYEVIHSFSKGIGYMNGNKRKLHGIPLDRNDQLKLKDTLLKEAANGRSLHILWVRFSNIKTFKLRANL